MQQLPLKLVESKPHNRMIFWGRLNRRREPWDLEEQLAPEIILHPLRCFLVLVAAGEIVAVLLPSLGEVSAKNVKDGKNRRRGPYSL